MGIIYKIKNVLDNECYIGSTVQKFIIRKNRHLRHLRKNKHFNNHLQNAWNLYGEQNFIFEIIEECNKDLTRIREQFYIDLINPSYNICKIVNKPNGRKWTREQREELSKKMKNNKFSVGRKISLDTRNKISQTLRTKCSGSLTKLNWDKISEIRNQFKNLQISKAELGRKFQVDRSTICRIINNEIWSV